MFLVAALLPALWTHAAAADDTPPPPPPGAQPATGPTNAVPMDLDDRSADLPRFPSSVEDLSAPRIPPPFVLPELSHPDMQLDFTWMLGVGSPEDKTKANNTLALAAISFERTWLLPRRLYVGVTIPFASALAPDGTSGSKTVLGNLEAHVRAILPLPTTLAFGAYLSIVAPTALYGASGPGHDAALEAAALDPTNIVFYEPGVVAIRPGVDIRVLRGPFVIQVRQGFDFAVTTSGRAATVGRFLGHAGIRIKDDLELSIEGTELYQFADSVPDERRTAMTIGPGARILFRGVDIGLAGVTNLLSPLSPAIDHFYALKISIIPHLD